MERTLLSSLGNWYLDCVWHRILFDYIQSLGARPDPMPYLRMERCLNVSVHHQTSFKSNSQPWKPFCKIRATDYLYARLLFSIQDFDTTVGSDYEQPVLQILIDIFGEGGAIVLMTLIMVCVYHCGLFSMTSNSRMMFGFSRDGGLPHFFDKVDKRHRAPIRAIWLAATLSFLLAVPSLGSTVAFSAATSIATIGKYFSALSYPYPARPCSYHCQFKPSLIRQSNALPIHGTRMILVSISSGFLDRGLKGMLTPKPIQGCIFHTAYLF